MKKLIATLAFLAAAAFAALAPQLAHANATLTNLTGTSTFLDPTTGLNRRFYQARQLQ